MSNEIRLFKVIARIINKYLPGMLEENRVTLAYLITGIIGAKNVQLKKVANKVVYGGKETSLVERFRRFLRNEKIVVKVEFMPFVELILSGLKNSRLVLAIDSSKVGGRCICLMISVVYKSRALPLCWVVFKGRKGHSSLETQLALFKTLKTLLPAEQEVIILGDGEFDGGELVDWFKQQEKWAYVCRTANSNKIFYQGQWQSLADLDLVEEKEYFLENVLFTETGQVGPLNILVVWNKKEQTHWFFITNFDTSKQAKKWYRKRFSIETLFSDVKGRGFNLDKTRIWKPERVHRLIFAVAISYVFTIFLGVELIMHGPFDRLFRTDRFFHSLFQLGLSYLNYLLKFCLHIPEPDAFPHPDSFEHFILVS